MTRDEILDMLELIILKARDNTPKHEGEIIRAFNIVCREIAVCRRQITEAKKR